MAVGKDTRMIQNEADSDADTAAADAPGGSGRSTS
jgi:hypothetical protein